MKLKLFFMLLIFSNINSELLNVHIDILLKAMHKSKVSRKDIENNKQLNYYPNNGIQDVIINICKNVSFNKHKDYSIDIFNKYLANFKYFYDINTNQLIDLEK